MNDDRMDLEALDPTRDADFDTRVAAVAAHAMAARTGASRGVLADLVRWTRPALIAAAVIVAVTIPVLVRARQAGERPPARGASSAEILGIPQGLIALGREAQPSVVQLAEAVGVSSSRSAP